MSSKIVSCVYELLNNADSSCTWDQDGTITLQRPLASSKLDKIKFRSFSANIKNNILNLTSPELNFQLCANIEYLGKNNYNNDSEVLLQTGQDEDILYINNQTGTQIYKPANGSFQNNINNVIVLREFKTPLITDFQTSLQDGFTQAKYELCKILGIYDEDNKPVRYNYNSFYNNKKTDPPTASNLFYDLQTSNSPYKYPNYYVSNGNTYLPAYIHDEQITGRKYNSGTSMLDTNSINSPFVILQDGEYILNKTGNFSTADFTLNNINFGTLQVDNLVTYEKLIYFSVFNNSMTSKYNGFFTITKYNSTGFTTLNYINDRAFNVCFASGNYSFFIPYKDPALPNSMKNSDGETEFNKLYEKLNTAGEDLTKIYLYHVVSFPIPQDNVPSNIFIVIAVDTSEENNDKFRIFVCNERKGDTDWRELIFYGNKDSLQTHGIVNDFHNVTLENAAEKQNNLINMSTCGTRDALSSVIMLPYFTRQNGTTGTGYVKWKLDASQNYSETLEVYIQNTEAFSDCNCKLAISYPMSDSKRYILEYIHNLNSPSENKINYIKYMEYNVNTNLSDFYIDSNCTIRNVDDLNFDYNNVYWVNFMEINNIKYLATCEPYSGTGTNLKIHDLEFNIDYNYIYCFANSNIYLKANGINFVPYVPTIADNNNYDYSWARGNHTSQTKNRPYYLGGTGVDFNFINKIFKWDTKNNTIIFPNLAMIKEGYTGTENDFDIANILFYVRIYTTPSVLEFDPNYQQGEVFIKDYYNTKKQITDATPSLYYNTYSTLNYFFYPDTELFDNIGTYLELQQTDQTLKLICDNYPTLNNIVFYLNETSMIDFKETFTGPTEPNIKCRIVDTNGMLITPKSASNIYSNLTLCLDWEFYN